MKETWRVFVADAFAKDAFSGNQAGVILLEDRQEFPKDAVMKKIAGELKHSETAFVKRLGQDVFHIRYFTPAEEVALCGHATIGAFQVLCEEKVIMPGEYRLHTKAQDLTVKVEKDSIWMEMAVPREIGALTEEQSKRVYRAYGLSIDDIPSGMIPKKISAGLCDIMLPVKNEECLQNAKQDERAVLALSKEFEVVGVHMFVSSKEGEITAKCRNFAPLYEIPEEAATGTSNGALTYYLYKHDLIKPEEVNTFLQGEAMGKPSFIKSKLFKGADKQEITIWIGGQAVVSLKGELLGNEKKTQ